MFCPWYFKSKRTDRQTGRAAADPFIQNEYAVKRRDDLAQKGRSQDDERVKKGSAHVQIQAFEGAEVRKRIDNLFWKGPGSSSVKSTREHAYRQASRQRNSASQTLGVPECAIVATMTSQGKRKMSISRVEPGQHVDHDARLDLRRCMNVKFLSTVILESLVQEKVESTTQHTESRCNV